MDDTNTWPPVGKPFEQWAHQTYDEGGVLPTGATVASSTPVLTAKAAAEGLAWIRDHYRDGTFHCPASQEG